jgi:hypothetical protein
VSVVDRIEPLPSGEDSPWAHDVPIPPPADLPLAWSTSRPSPGSGAVRETGSRRAAPIEGDTDATPVAIADGLRLHPEVDRLPPHARVAGTVRTTPAKRRRTMLVAGVVGVVAVAAIGVRVIGDGAGDRASEAAVGSRSDGPLVASSGSLVDTASAPATTQVRAGREPGTTMATLPEPEPEWVTTRIDLNRRLQVMSTPAELVAVGRDGTLYSISIPSGEVHSINTKESTTDTELVLGVESILFMIRSTGSSTLAHVDRPLLPLGPDMAISLVLPRPGVDEFLVVPDTAFGSTAAPYVLSADGTQAEVAAGPFAAAPSWAMRMLPNGETVVSDTGGVYVIADGGEARRISVGDLVAVGPNHYLLRECDEMRTCGFVRVDAATDERSAVVFEPATPYVEQAVVSPDGAAMMYVEYGDEGPVRSIVELDNGESVELEISDRYGTYGANGTTSTWAPDSSGVFAIDEGGIVFCDRVTCEPIASTSDELDDIVAVAVRPQVQAVAP